MVDVLPCMHPWTDMEEPAVLCATSDIQLFLGDEWGIFPDNLDEDDSGQEVQRISVVSNLPDLLRDSNAECMRRVVPKVGEVLHVAQTEMQLAACTAFLQILQKQLVPLGNYTQTFLQTILEAIDSKDPDVANAWLETLLDVIDLLPKDIIKQEILSKAIAKGQMSQSVQARLSCCKILGKIATKCEPFVIKKEILPVVQSLCQDVEYEVRGCMCHQLDPVARGLGLEATKNAILPELVELTNDEESFVRLAGLETVVQILSLLDEETHASTIIPLICKFCEQALRNEDSTLLTVAQQIGPLCHGLQGNLADDQKRWLLDFYKQLCQYGINKKQPVKEEEDSLLSSSTKSLNFQTSSLVEEDKAVGCRKNAAFNFPAMVLFAGPKSFKSELYSSFNSLCTDPHHLVRKTIAFGFHEVALVLGTNIHMLRPADLVSLLEDDSIEVLKGVVTYLPQTLELLTKSGGCTLTEAQSSPHLSQMSVMSSELIPALLQAEGMIAASNNWRLHAEIIQKMACLPHCFTSDQIYHKFLPLMFCKLHTARALPVKLAAVDTLLQLQRQNCKLEQRKEICHRLIKEFCFAHSCYKRTLFLDICKGTMEHFSRKFFKEHMFEPLLKLHADPVANIRLRLCPLLPELKCHIKLPSERNLLQLLESCVRTLLAKEKDRDVIAVLEKAVTQLDKVQVQMESLTKKPVLDDDLADLEKEEEEKHLIDLEEKEEREHEAHTNKVEKKKDRKDSGTKIPAPKRVSRIPAATSTREKTVGSPSSTSSRGEKNGFSAVHVREVKRTSSFSSKSDKGSNSRLPKSSGSGARSPSFGARSSSGSTNTRKSSASLISPPKILTGSSGSLSAAATRRSSMGSSDIPRRTSPTLRRISTGNLGHNGNPTKKKKVPTATLR